MPQFEYTAWNGAPYAASVAELLARAGDPAARAAIATAQANGRAREISGQAYGNAAQNIGNTIAAIPGQIQQQKDDAVRRQIGQQQVKTGAIQIAKDERTTADLKALDAAFASGNGRDAILNAVPGHLRPEVMKQFQEADKLGENAKKDAEAARKSQAEHFGFLGAQIKQANYDPATALAAIHHARETYADDPALLKQIDQLRMGVIEQPESIKQIADNAILGSSYKDMLKPVPQKTRAELAADAANPLSPTQKQSVTALDLMNPPKEPPKPPAVGTFEDYVVRKFGPNPTPAQIEQGRKAFGDAGRVTVVTPPNGGAGTLDEDGLDLAATSYRLTRQLPSRNAAQNGAILSRAAKQAKQLGDSPAATIQRQAAYKSDAGSLDKITKMADAAESFETKALGQADIVAELSKKVGRTASPMLNGWILAGKDHVLGDSDTHQLFNAVSTFSAEYAKIMEGSTGSAAGSSDSARKASERLISAAQNTGSMADTLALMKREMRLTIGGYGATIAHITGRMGGGESGATVSVTDPLGGVHQFASQAAADAFKAKAGIK